MRGPVHGFTDNAETALKERNRVEEALLAGKARPHHPDEVESEHTLRFLCNRYLTRKSYK